MKKYPTFVDELAMSRVERSTADLSPSELNELYRRRPAWLEAVVRAELRQGRGDAATKTSFLLSDPGQKLETIVKHIETAAQRAKTGQAIKTELLTEHALKFVDDYIAANPESQLAQLKAQLMATPSGREFLWGDPNATWEVGAPRAPGGQNPRAGLLLGVIGQKSPDFVHVDLGSSAGPGSLAVVDATFAVGDPRHLFKSAFYKAVLQEMTGLPTSATDRRSDLRKRDLE